MGFTTRSASPRITAPSFDHSAHGLKITKSVGRIGLKPEWVRALGIDSATIYNLVHWSNPGGNPDYTDWAKRGTARFDSAKGELGVAAYFPHASVGWDTNPRYPKGVVRRVVEPRLGASI